MGEGDSERTRDRDGRNNALRAKRAEGDQDSDGWSTVKPRKSFGTEGAERFNGRMGLDRHRDDKRFKDREDRERDRDSKDRPRGFDTFSRDKDGDLDQDRDSRRPGAGRGRNESWFKDRESADNPSHPRDRNSNGDRFVDRSRGWREKERDDRGDRATDRGGDRDRVDRRWDRDRDQRQEREPEWMDEPHEEKRHGHTQEDFQKWKDQMSGKDKGAKSTADKEPSKAESGAAFFGLEQPKVETPLEIDTGPDKFFGMWAAPKEEATLDAGLETKKEGVSKSKTVGKSSRFTSFFTPATEEPPRRRADPPQPIAQEQSEDGFAALAQARPQSPEEREAFQLLLQKLQRQTVNASGSTPPANSQMQPKPPLMEPQSNPNPVQEQFQQYRPDRQDEGRPSTRNSQQQALQDLLTQRQVAGSQPTIRPEQMLQDLVGQRQTALSQTSNRPDHPQSRNTNTEFLMGLMQSAKAAPDPQRSEQILLRMPPKSMDRQMQQQVIEREQEMHREAAQRDRSASQRQARPHPPPGLFDDPTFQRGPPSQHQRQGGNPPQLTQILQRPPAPGLEIGWDRQAPLQPPAPPQHRLAQNIAPPPGLAAGLNRGMPMPQQMFPPGFPMGSFPPPDVMAGPPRNMQMQAPPGFFNAPPGFMPPVMPSYQGPENMSFGAPFDGRRLPPQGAFRRQ